MVGITITGSTRLVGIVGDPVEHSLSPLMHNAAFSRLGLPYAYVPLPVPGPALPDALRGLLACGFQGFNVTIPHKEAVARLLSTLDNSARRVGAVNTVVREGGTWVGWNTDGPGFLAALAEAGHRAEGRRVLVLGAGGAARAIAAALLDAGARALFVANRRWERARRLLEDLGAPRGAPLPLEAPALEEQGPFDLIVNTIPAGAWLPPARLLQPPTVVCDIVYTPRITPLVATAMAQGCPVVTGEGMLVHQGACAFELWTGRPAPVLVMREVVERALGSRDQPPTRIQCADGP